MLLTVAYQSAILSLFTVIFETQSRFISLNNAVNVALSSTSRMIFRGPDFFSPTNRYCDMISFNLNKSKTSCHNLAIATRPIRRAIFSSS